MESNTQRENASSNPTTVPAIAGNDTANREAVARQLIVNQTTQFVIGTGSYFADMSRFVQQAAKNIK